MSIDPNDAGAVRTIDPDDAEDLMWSDGLLMCQSCGEPVAARQKRVAYPGENLDVPIGPEPTYHLRARCRRAAEAYERRWVAVDPRRERVLTWPKCHGALAGQAVLNLAGGAA